MKLQYDPADGDAFWQAISRLPGYPAGEEMPIPVMLFESGALHRLPQVLSRLEADPDLPVFVVTDPTPMRRGAESLKPLILQVLRAAGWNAVELVMEADTTGQVHTDMPHIHAVRKRLLPGAAVMAVGSGTICDIAKHACYLYDQETGQKLPFVVYQTANSVSAFTSNMAPTFVDGVKRTLASRYPDALVCDLETLRDAPHEMTAAGVGDLLAAFTSLPDWYLAHRLGMDRGYSTLPRALIGPMDEIFLAHAEAIHNGELEAMSVLARLIALGGLAMSLSHATTPMSGYEHVISHILDLQAELTSQPLAVHGAQAALATVLAAGAYQHFLAEFESAEVQAGDSYPQTGGMEDLIRRTFAGIDPSGKAGEECWADYRQKLDAWQAHRPDFETFLADWPAIREELRSAYRSPERIVEILKAIGAPQKFSELTPPATEAQVRFAFLNAPLMRKRLTLGDLLIFLKWDRDRLWKQVWLG
jgi:glycerol-1-phosphate dehydrogenase [NAD(P)+]